MKFFEKTNEAFSLNSEAAEFSSSILYCNEIVNKVSRTFAIGIHVLKGQIKNSVLVGYLLCRIADTIEDDLSLITEDKIYYLEKFQNCFSDRNQISFICKIADKLTGDESHINLVRNCDKVFRVFESLSFYTKSVLIHWVSEMICGMKKFLRKHDNKLRIQSLSEFKEYCYYVAGTVGCMLTDLWKEHALLFNEKLYQSLYKISSKFGEGLQIINILKDIFWDKQKENSIYIPEEILKRLGSSHENLLNKNFYFQNEIAAKELMFLAQKDLLESVEYVKKIPKINPRIRFFCALPLLLAIGTLNKLKSSDNIISSENKIKISKSEVSKIIRQSFFSSISNWWFEKSVKKLMKN